MLKVYKNGMLVKLEDIKSSFSQCEALTLGLGWSGQVGGRYEILYKDYLLDYRLSLAIDLMPTDRNIKIIDKISKDENILVDIHDYLNNTLN